MTGEANEPKQTGRLSVLEYRLSVIERDFASFLEQDRRDKTSIMASLAALSKQLDGHTRFVGGIVFTISCIWLVIASFKDVIVSAFR